MKQFRALAFLLALLPAVAAAQTFPTVPSNTFIGRTGIGSGPSQAIPFSSFLPLSGFVTLPVANGNVSIFDGTTGKVKDSGASGAFIAPKSYPVVTNSGAVFCPLSADCQFGNNYSQYPLGSVSANPILLGKAASSIGSTTPGQTFKIVFTSAGLVGSPITITYTAGGAETTSTIATGLCNLVNANTVLHGTGGKPIFCQPIGGGVFNLQYDDAFGATGATPLTTATTGSTGTITLGPEQNALDYIVMQLGRAVPNHTGKAGDGIYALDFTGQDSTGAFNTHYGAITVAVDTATAGSQRGAMYFNTAGGNGNATVGRMKIVRGVQLFDAAGANPVGADKGPGTINLPSGGGLYFDGGPAITNNTGASQFKMESLVGSIIISGSAGVGLNATPTNSTFTSALGTFVSGTQVPTTGSGISLAGGATPVLSARNYGTAARLPLSVDTSALSVVTGAGTLNVPAVADTLVGKATTDTLTNKTFDTGGTGNSLSIAGVAVTANSGTGAMLRAGGNPTVTGQLSLNGGTPTIGSGNCGTGTNGVVTSGTNQAGLITIGAAATTTCTISFSATLATAPAACMITPQNAAAAATGTTVARVSSISTTNWVITGSALANAAYYYHCI